jgi:peroxiredoxin Q/BCP
MAVPTVGKKISAFAAATTASAKLTNKDLAGRPYVLYFYPKDDTPGCTLEGKDFRDSQAKFGELKVRILGVSRDTLTSHAKFQRKYELPFELISDADEKLCKQFDVIKEKNMYGKKYWGIERSTFVIDTEGKVKAIFRKVQVDGHADEVLMALKA